MQKSIALILFFTTALLASSYTTTPVQEVTGVYGVCSRAEHPLVQLTLNEDLSFSLFGSFGSCQTH